MIISQTENTKDNLYVYKDTKLTLMVSNIYCVLGYETNTDGVKGKSYQSKIPPYSSNKNI